MRKLLIPIALALAGAIGFALAQSTPLYNLLGTETQRITLGSGSGITIPISQIQNTQGVSPIGAGTTVASSPTGLSGILVATGSITTWDVTLPNPAYNGQVVTVVADNGTITTLRVTASTSPQTQTLNSAFSQSLTATSPVGWAYKATSSTVGTWFRVN